MKWWIELTLPGILIIVVTLSSIVPQAFASSSCFYLTQVSTSYGTDLEPLLPVTYINPSNGVSLNQTILFDSGATVSLAPSTLATALGLNLSNSTTLQVGGISGSPITANLVNLTLTIGSQKFNKVEVAVASVSTVAYLLGRINFLSLASVTIDSTNTKTICIGPAPSPGFSFTLTFPLLALWIGAIGVIGVVIWKGRKK